jgi:hypothetical protein
MSIDEDAAMQRLASELSVSFPTATLPQVDLLISGLRDLFRAAPIREFLPLLIRRAALDHFTGRTVLSFDERIGGDARCPGAGSDVAPRTGSVTAKPLMTAAPMSSRSWNLHRAMVPRREGGLV